MRTILIALFAAMLARADEFKPMHSDKLGVEFVVPSDWEIVPTGRPGRFMAQDGKEAAMALAKDEAAHQSAREALKVLEDDLKSQMLGYERVDVAFLHRVTPEDAFELIYTMSKGKETMKLLSRCFVQPDATWLMTFMAPEAAFEKHEVLFRDLIKRVRIYDEGYESPERALDTMLRGMGEKSPDRFLKSFLHLRSAEYGNEKEFAKLSKEEQKEHAMTLHMIRTRQHSKGFNAGIAKGFVEFEEMESSDEACRFEMVTKSADGEETRWSIRLEKVEEGWRAVEMCDVKELK